MTRAHELLIHLRSYGARLAAEGGNLVCDAPKGVVTPEIYDALRGVKHELIAILKQEASPTPDHVDTSSDGQSAIEARATAFLDQVEKYWRQLDETWADAKHRPIPPLVLPGPVAAPGTCELCGEPLTDGHTYRCSVCVKAVNLMLARLLDEADG